MSFWLLLAAIHGFIAVAAGAFGAHGLKERLAPEMLTIFETGARYEIYHALALTAVAFASHLFPKPKVWNVAGWGFFSGALIFSGSLYALALSGIKTFGAITPIGGVAMLIGWAALGVGALPRSQTAR